MEMQDVTRGNKLNLKYVADILDYNTDEIFVMLGNRRLSVDKVTVKLVKDTYGRNEYPAIHIKTMEEE